MATTPPPFRNNDKIHPETPNPFSSIVYPETDDQVGTVVKNKPSTSLAHTQALLAKRGELTQQKIDERNAWGEGGKRTRRRKSQKKTRKPRKKSRRRV